MAVYKVNIELDANEIAAALTSENPGAILGGDVTVLREDDQISDNENLNLEKQVNNTSNDPYSIVNTEELEFDNYKSVLQNMGMNMISNKVISNSLTPQFNVFNLSNKIDNIFEFEHEEVSE